MYFNFGSWLVENKMTRYIDKIETHIRYPLL